MEPSTPTPTPGAEIAAVGGGGSQRRLQPPDVQLAASALLGLNPQLSCSPGYRLLSSRPLAFAPSSTLNRSRFLHEPDRSALAPITLRRVYAPRKTRCLNGDSRRANLRRCF